MDQFDQSKVTADKLISCSPFREERHPSFAVNLENGTWIDSGSISSNSKGNLIQLLALLREETTEETADHLLDSYSLLRRDTDGLMLDMSFLDKKKNDRVFTTKELQKYAFRHVYLEGRGISEKTQRLFRIGYDKHNAAVVMPWADVYGNIVNIKFRSIRHKQFWYAAEGQPVSNHLYGLYQYNQQDKRTLWIVESEIDCMKLWTLDIPAVALGTAHLSRRQKKLLLNCSAETLVISTDNDKAGRDCCRQLSEELAGYKVLKHFVFSVDIFSTKDIADLSEYAILNSDTRTYVPVMLDQQE